MLAFETQPKKSLSQAKKKKKKERENKKTKRRKRERCVFGGVDQKKRRAPRRD